MDVVETFDGFKVVAFTKIFPFVDAVIVLYVIYNGFTDANFNVYFCPTIKLTFWQRV